MTRTCACGADISHRRPNAKWCEACYKAKQREAGRKHYAKTHAPMQEKKLGLAEVSGSLSRMPDAKPPAGEPEKRPLADAMTALGLAKSELTFAGKVRAFHAACYAKYADETDPGKRKQLALTMAQLNVLETAYKR